MTGRPRAQELAAELIQELQDYPPPVGFDRMAEDLDEALDVIVKLLERLDDYYEAAEGQGWVDIDGNKAPPMRNWMDLKCFGEDHDLYDAIMALRGRNRRKVRP